MSKNEVLTKKEKRATMRRVAESIDAPNIVMTHWHLVADAIEQAVHAKLTAGMELPSLPTPKTIQIFPGKPILPHYSADEMLTFATESIATMQAKLEHERKSHLEAMRHLSNNHSILFTKLEQSQAWVVELEKELERFRLLADARLKRSVISATQGERHER